MSARFKKKSKIEKHDFSKNNNRINIVMAIVFLLGLATIYKLYILQVKNYDLYSDMAQGQHQISSELEPERGTIYINDYGNKKEDGGLYPFATNKDFAFLYVVPKDIKDPDIFAESLYEVFKKKQVEGEVDNLLTEQERQKKEEELSFISNWPDEERIPKEEEIIWKYDNLHLDATYMELRTAKREKEIEDRKEAVIEDYLAKLEKENDPYEPIEKKVPEGDLFDLIVLLKKEEEKELEAKDLYIKEGKVWTGKGEAKKEIVVSGLGFNMVNYRYYPEGEIGSHILGFVRRTNDGEQGNYGLEGFFDDELRGQYGYIKSERSADRNIIILNDREYIKPINGKDLVLTIDRSVQFNVCKIFNETAAKYQADGGSVVVMDPKTGAILAMCSWPLFDPNNYDKVEDISIFNNPVVFGAYEPGSVFKTITMAAAINEEKITPDTTYDDEGFLMIDGWPKPIKNSDYDSKGGHGEVDMNYVLEHSLNTGAIYAMRQIGGERFAEYVENFGFGEKTGIELSGEVTGNISNLQTEKIHEIYSATASFGQGITVTPLQMIDSYAAIANGGVLMKPYLVKAIIHEDGSREEVKPVEVRRVISERAATLVSGMLVNVVEGGHAIRAAVKGYYVGGKTGTAQVASSKVRGYSGRTNHTFIGMAPIEDPKFVMLVKLDNPKGVAYAAGSCAPLFGQISEFLLNYWQVPKERK